MRTLARLLPWVVLAFAAAPLAAQSPSPTPKDWQQWQPQTDQSDTRLDARVVTVWREEMTVEELLTAMQAASGVELLATAEALPVRLSVFAEQRSLEGMMVALGAALGGYWVFPRGATGTRRSYCLVLRSSPTGSPDSQSEEHWARLQRAIAEARRPDREARLALYRQALKLSPEEILSRYQESDPWLCADVLRSGGRPLLDYVLSLPAEQSSRLMQEGELAVRVNALPPSMRDCVAKWWHDAESVYGTGCMSYEWGPDQVRTGFICQDDWAASYVKLSWFGEDLILDLDVPGTGGRQLGLIRGSQQMEMGALQDLLAMGYAKETPEYQARIRRAYDEWDRTMMDPQANPVLADAYRVGPAPNVVDPRLETAIPLNDVGGHTLSAADIFARAARHCQVAALAIYLPPEAAQFRLPEPRPQQMTLGDLLGRIRQCLPSSFSWDFHGQYLVATDESYRLVQAGILSPEVRATWERWIRSGVALPLDQLAVALAALNLSQLDKLMMAFPESGAFTTLPLSGLRLYGRLTPEQRARLREADGLPLAELSAEQQRIYLRAAQQQLPWAQRGDFGAAVLRAVPVTLAGGAPGLSFVVEYHLADLPDARYVMFAQPLTITFSPAPAAGP